ncbi:hypothetical protein BDZ91DRAFT_792766 [Kalaharituber pfeilii]|nr:hypothetical protein BDZ91DRAFT_792766 [Kalaharituber pfeilii]
MPRISQKASIQKKIDAEIDVLMTAMEYDLDSEFDSEYSSEEEEEDLEELQELIDRSAKIPNLAHTLEILLRRGHNDIDIRFEPQFVIKGRQTSFPASSQSSKINWTSQSLGDIAQSGAFDQAIVSDPPFDYILHTASPFHFNVTDVKKQLIEPAIRGTTGILASAKKYAPTVKRVVITSSFASVFNPFKETWAGEFSIIIPYKYSITNSD